MIEILDQLNKWRCANPDEVNTPEYRALYDTLSQSLTSAMAGNVDAQASQVALASVDEFISQAEALRRRIIRWCWKPASAEPRCRVQIVNWRKHGDDESYCWIEVFGADDITDIESLIEKEYNVRCGAEDEGDYGATYYVNDDMTIADGDIRISREGRRFRISIVPVE